MCVSIPFIQAGLHLHQATGGIVFIFAFGLNPLYPSGSSSTRQTKQAIPLFSSESQSPLSKRVFIYIYRNNRRRRRIQTVSIPFIQAGLHLQSSCCAEKNPGKSRSQSPLSKRVFIYPTSNLLRNSRNGLVSIPFIQAGLHLLYPVKPLSGGLLRACLHGSWFFQPPQGKFAFFLHSDKYAWS